MNEPHTSEQSPPGEFFSPLPMVTRGELYAIARCFGAPDDLPPSWELLELAWKRYVVAWTKEQP